jgi:hypothetical protein
LNLAGSAATVQIDNLLIDGTGGEGLYAGSASGGHLLIGRDSGDSLSVSNTGATAVYFNGSAMNVTVAATGSIIGSGTDALIFDGEASGDYLMPGISVSVTNLTDTAFSDVLSLSKLEGTSPYRIELDYQQPAAGLLISFVPQFASQAGLGGEAVGSESNVLLVDPGATFAVASYISADPGQSFLLEGYQLNFAASDILDGELQFSNWSTNVGQWPLSLGELDTASGQTLVGGAALGSGVAVGSSTQLGSFTVVAPKAAGDYLITIQSGDGPLGTALMQADGSPAPVANYGDIVIRVGGGTL